MFHNEQAMVRLEMARESLSRLLAYRSHVPTGQFGHGGRRKPSPDERMEHVLSRGSHHITDDRGQLDIGIL
jgi:hypothetical protein